jgi:2-polyprenyl-3-methyl-5-hydroxy-6-metoxy-1,4-benzoquinol methylase
MSDFRFVNEFLNEFEFRAKLFYPKIRQNFENNEAFFGELAEKMLSWAYNFLGDDLWPKTIEGYKKFVADVNRSQMKYEKTEEYMNASYEDVFKNVYDNAEFMEMYHWGVYITTFAWEHHLELHKYFNESFLDLFPDEELQAIDLGAGSGIWSMFIADRNNKWKTIAVDISEKSVALTTKFIECNDFSNNIVMKADDALTYKTDELNDFGVSCFLIEHLENPINLLENLNENLKPGAYAFVTAALTAAEIDHIFEIKKESELILMAEKAGFRVISSYSAAPKNHPRKLKFLPRSMGMVLQKKINSIW